MKIPPKTELFKTPINTTWLGQDKIVYSISTPGERSIANFLPMFEIYKKLSQNGSVKISIIIDFSDAQPLSNDVREYLYTELPKYVKALALVSKTPQGKMLANIFKELHTQQYPISVFDDVDYAREWIARQA